MSKESCLLTPKSLQELEGIASQHDIVLFIKKPGCPACAQIEPFMEKACSESNPDLKFIKCSVEDPHCRKAAEAMKIKSVPHITSIPRGNNILQPEWTVIGSKASELGGKINATNKRISGGKSPKVSQPPPQVHHPPQYAPPNPSMDPNVVRIMKRMPPNPSMNVNRNIATFQAPKPTPKLCVPGTECTREEFDANFVDFFRRL